MAENIRLTSAAFCSTALSIWLLWGFFLFKADLESVCFSSWTVDFGKNLPSCSYLFGLWMFIFCLFWPKSGEGLSLSSRPLRLLGLWLSFRAGEYLYSSTLRMIYEGIVFLVGDILALGIVFTYYWLPEAMSLRISLLYFWFSCCVAETSKYFP